MRFTAREYQVIRKQRPRWATAVYALVELTVPLGRVLWRIGFVRRYLDRTVGGRVGAISRCAERGDHERAADLAIEALKAYRYQPTSSWRVTGSDYWWFFMRMAARSLEKTGDPDKWDEVIELARNGIEPFEGYDVAWSFLAFSRWKHKSRDPEAALEFAEVAARADETWVEPDFVLGWYALTTGKGDAVEHLSRAIGKEPRMMDYIAKDPVCSRHPEVIERVRDQSSQFRNGDDRQTPLPT